VRLIFTPHAGEYLVGSEIEERFKHLDVWVPATDRGLDLLITNPGSKKMVSLQVKFSKDFRPTHIHNSLQIGLKSCGWWTIDLDKLSRSVADFWVFVLRDINQKGSQFIIVEPKTLLEKLKTLHGAKSKINSYLWVTKRDKCWETRGLNKREQTLVANHKYENPGRDFTDYLNNWEQILSKLAVGNQRPAKQAMEKHLPVGSRWMEDGSYLNELLKKGNTEEKTEERESLWS
jgi:hypothetical protein